MGIRRIFGKSAEPDVLTAEVKAVLDDMRRERSSFEAGLVRAADLVRSSEALSASLAETQRSVEALTARLASADALAGRVSAQQSDLDALARRGRETQERIEGIARSVDEARAAAEALRPELQELAAFKAEIPEVLERAAPVRELDGRLREAMDQAEALGRRHAEIGSRVDEAATKLEGMQERFDGIAGSLEGATTKMDAFERTAADLRQLMTDAPNLRRELGTLRALAEFVSQKLAALDGQRIAVERATRRAEGLTELMEQVDRQVAEQQGNAKFLTTLEERVQQLKTLHETLLTQSEETRRRQGEIDALVRAQREAFESARTAMQDALSGFTFEREGLAAVHQRVQDLREAVRSAEERMPALDAAQTGLADAEAAAERLGTRVAGLREEVDQVEASVETLAPVRQEIGRVEAAARELVRRVEHATQPAVTNLEETERRVAELNTAVEGLEARTGQVTGQQAVLAEVAREITVRQGALDRALAELARATELRKDTTELAARLDLETGALRTRLTEAGESAARAEGQLMQFEERSRRLAEEGARLTTLERRFSDVLEAAEKLERAAAALTSRQAALDAVRDDLTRVFGVAEATVEKARSVAALQKEIEQRRQAVDELAGRLRSLDRFGERLDARQAQFAEAEHQLQLLDAHLADMKATLGTVLEQRSFLEKAVEATGALTFQTVHAETILGKLRAETGEAGAPGRRSSGAAPAPEAGQG